jgi:eukaryotic-like serine/threonine-protein kinase
VWPETLPGGRGVLFTIAAQGGGPDTSQVAVYDFQTEAQKVLVRGGSDGFATGTGYLLYATTGAVSAVQFDENTLNVHGAAVPILAQVVTTYPFNAVDARIARNGTMVYIPGDASRTTRRTLVWVDRIGHEIPIGVPAHAYMYPRISPDGSRVVAWVNEYVSDLWMWELKSGILTRLTVDPARALYPIWTPDGQQIVFSSERSGGRTVFEMGLDGNGNAEPITTGPNADDTTAVSPDGRYAVFTEASPNTGLDIMQVELGGEHRITPLVRTQFAERNGTISPDGRWIAYEANDTGQLEVYVRPYPAVQLGRWQVSTGGGTRPVFAPGSKELVYVSADGALMSVGIEPGPTWRSTATTQLMKPESIIRPGGNPGRVYDISPDGQRFLIIKEPRDSPASSSLVVAEHFDEELRSKFQIH